VDAPVKDAVNLRLGLGMSKLERPRRADGEAPEYLEWLRKRVHGAGGGATSWLEGQTIEQVLAASEVLGAILEHGHAVRVTKLKPMQTEEATDIGFSIYREGPAAIEEALNTIRQTSSATAVQAGSLAYYGNLFDWLDRRCNALDPGPIRDILRDHIVKHSAIEPGTRVLGVEITERRYHTIYSLSTEVRIDRPRLSRLLKKLGQVPQGATEIETGNMVFNSVETVSLIEAFRTAIPLSDVPDYLGASKRQVEILYREGLLKPLIPRNGRGSVRHVVFSRKHLDDLLCKIDAFPELDLGVATNLHPVSYACQRGAGRFEDVFRKILAGVIPCFRHPDHSGIGAIFVDVGALLGLKIPS